MAEFSEKPEQRMATGVYLGSKFLPNKMELPKNYFLCHNFWVIKSSAILQNNGEQPWSFMGKKTKPYIIKKTIDIHDYSDVALAKYLVKNSKKN